MRQQPSRAARNTVAAMIGALDEPRFCTRQRADWMPCGRRVRAGEDECWQHKTLRHGRTCRCRNCPRAQEMKRRARKS